jgi:DNA polymerase I-like protein with 3'-5' exonuclease and polymerase domains
MLMSYINDAGNHRHNMDELAKVHFNRETIKFKDRCWNWKITNNF